MQQCESCTFRAINTKKSQYKPYCIIWGKKTSVIMKCHMHEEGDPIAERLRTLEK